MTKAFLEAAISQGLQIFIVIAAILLAWQLYLFVIDNPKKFGFIMKRVAMKKKKERQFALLRWSIGVLLVLASFGLANTFLSVIGEGSLGQLVQSYLTSMSPDAVLTIGDVFFGNDFTYLSFATGVLLVISGIALTLSCLWRPLRYVGDAFFGAAFLYSLARLVQVTFLAEANIYQLITDTAYFYLSLFGFIFFLLTITFTVKALAAYDLKKMKLVRQRLEQMFQLGMGLMILVVSAGVISTITISFPAPESFTSLMLDGESAIFRYTVILYLFGVFIFLRQIFSYFRYGLMGLLSLSCAYIIFDAINYFL